MTFLWIYYALPIFLGINITRGWAGFLGLSLYIGSFYAEILRAGVQSVDRGQTDASVALGMSYAQRMRRIILPQAVRRMVPPFVGQSIIQMKNTTLSVHDHDTRPALPSQLHQQLHLQTDGDLHGCRRYIPDAYWCRSPFCSRRLERGHAGAH